MEIGNIKLRGSTYICRFPPNQNFFSLTYLSDRLEFVKRNKFWIAFTAILGFLGIAFIQYRLSFGPLEPVETGSDYFVVDLILFFGFWIFIVIVTALAFGKSAHSGRTRITRSTADSVDGYGGARARDFSYSPPSHSSKGGFPVSLRQKRKRTATFREGAKDHDDERSGESS